ncbi:MAG TPA: hypothetical protein VFM36_12260 [Thermoanaerobaculia bacterium]|nr:hypothetical protein [Thermoanaerobaculia bacterium]
MTFTRTALILSLAISLAGATASAQETATAAPVVTTSTSPAPAPTTATTATAEETASDREQTSADFNAIVNRHPDKLERLLANEPMLLLNDSFLAGYPDLAAFVAQHPEIRRNPHYYTRNFQQAVIHREDPAEEAVEAMVIMATLALIAFALAWLVRTIIEQKRWNRLSRQQTEVHNKILDRFSSSDELLAYIKTPAGTKFLESAPIPLHAERAPSTSPYSRVLWSIQVGVVIAAGGLGMLLVGARHGGSPGSGFFAIGAIAFCVGGGFIASALISLFLSRRLSAWDDRGAENRLGDSGLVR